ncbi:hypothetical protein KCU97_g18, partial [Aureobasidium melanogenum]
MTSETEPHARRVQPQAKEYTVIWDMKVIGHDRNSNSDDTSKERGDTSTESDATHDNCIFSLFRVQPDIILSQLQAFYACSLSLMPPPDAMAAACIGVGSVNVSVVLLDVSPFIVQANATMGKKWTKSIRTPARSSPLPSPIADTHGTHPLAPWLSDLLERRRHDTVHESVDFSKHCSGRFQHLGSQKCSCSRIDKNHERNVLNAVRVYLQWKWPRGISFCFLYQAYISFIFFSVSWFFSLISESSCLVALSSVLTSASSFLVSSKSNWTSMSSSLTSLTSLLHLIALDLTLSSSLITAMSSLLGHLIHSSSREAVRSIHETHDHEFDIQQFIADVLDEFVLVLFGGWIGGAFGLEGFEVNLSDAGGEGVGFGVRLHLGVVDGWLCHRGGGHVNNRFFGSRFLDSKVFPHARTSEKAHKTYKTSRRESELTSVLLDFFEVLAHFFELLVVVQVSEFHVEHQALQALDLSEVRGGVLIKVNRRPTLRGGTVP